MIPSTYEPSPASIRLNGKLMSLETPRVMGIINLTSDSFHAESRIQQRDQLLHRVASMLSEGADIIDIGAQSTRPGAELIDRTQEADVLIPAIEALTREFPGILISADTFYGQVARKAIGAGAAMINDVSAWQIDDEMLETIVVSGVPYVLMHMQGTPQTMQQNPVYGDITGEIIRFFSDKVNTLHKSGVCDIILDPGFGFGKNLDQNIELFKKSDSLSVFGLPLLAGISRKKTLQHITGTDAAHALNATTAAHVLLLQKGFRILRVHDVKEAREAISVWSVLGGESL